MKYTTFKDQLYDVLYIWKLELRSVFQDHGILIFFIVVPLVYPLLYGAIYAKEVVREVPVAVVDASRSSMSREYLRKVDATPDVKIVSYCADLEEARLLMKKSHAYGIIVIPEGFSKDIERGGKSQVSIYCDMSCMLYYKAMLIANTDVSLEMNKNIKARHAGNTTRRQEEIITYPVEYKDVAMFNPTGGFAVFLLPAVLILVIQQTLLLGIGLSAGTARENNRFRDLVPFNRHYNGTLRVVFGKGLCYFMLYLAISLYVFFIVPRIFGINPLALPGNLLLFLIPFLAACIFFAMTLSIFIRNRETCMMIFVFTSLPLLFISGISWPGSAIPAFWKYVAYIFPSTFGINGFVRLTNMGATLEDVIREYRILWIQAGFYFITTSFVYRYQIALSRRHIIEKYHEMKRKAIGMKA